MIEAVFFDLDGTLADTAPDLGAALNRLLEEEGLPSLPVMELRPYVSAGSRGLLKAGFGLTPEDERYPAMQSRFLDHYAQALCVDTTLFPGMEELLDALDQRQIRWGVVTNKPHRFSMPLMENLGLSQRASVVVSGDTTAHAKPHPEPLLEAARQLGLAPQNCLYVGDDERDVVAGRAATMGTVAATYGYLGQKTDVSSWGAHALINSPAELLQLLDKA
jgi:phosphoglycolate phosphatase